MVGELIYLFRVLSDSREIKSEKRAQSKTLITPLS
jgi:hypothetical protein